MKKESKPATEAQKTARERNWNKGRILGIRSVAEMLVRSKMINEKERVYLKMIINSSNIIIQNWNK